MSAVLPPPLIEVEGPADMRGESYGRQADSRIKLGLERYEAFFAARGFAWDRVISASRLLAGRLAAGYPEQLREIGAIARGAGVDEAEILLINGRSEVLNAAGLDIDNDTRNGLDDGCTAALVLPERTAEGRLIHGQNWDWRPECEDTAVILAVRRGESPDLMTYVEAGGLARAGMNQAGIAITGNNLQTANENWSKPGIPIAVIRRLVLEAATFANALQAVASAPRTISNNMMISCAAGGEGFDLECTPDEVFWIAPEDSLLTHANHFVSPAARAKVVDAGLMAGMDSLYRDRRVHSRLARAGRKITIADFEAAFADRFGAPLGVLRSPCSRKSSQSISATVATIIMDAGAGLMQVRQSPYKNETYVTYRL